MNYIKFGTGDKILVMLPGLSVKSVLLMGDAVKNAFRAYDKDYTIYLIDRREDVPPVYTVADMARDTAEKMKELGLEDVCLFGAWCISWCLVPPLPKFLIWAILSSGAGFPLLRRGMEKPYISISLRKYIHLICLISSKISLLPQERA